jgi:hypothetical protein
MFAVFVSGAYTWINDVPALFQVVFGKVIGSVANIDNRIIIQCFSVNNNSQNLNIHLQGL